MSEIDTLAALGSMHTVLAASDPPAGTESFYTIAKLAPIWAAGGGVTAYNNFSFGSIHPSSTNFLFCDASTRASVVGSLQA